MADDKPVIMQEERVLLVINDNTVHGNTRFQKYAFLLFKKYGKLLKKMHKKVSMPEFYSDWEPYHYGPYSSQLASDIEACVKNDLLKQSTGEGRAGSYSYYSLAIKGRVKWRKIFDVAPDEITSISERLGDLQFMKLPDMIKKIYLEYPEYTMQSRIKESLFS